MDLICTGECCLDDLSAIGRDNVTSPRGATCAIILASDVYGPCSQSLASVVSSHRQIRERICFCFQLPPSVYVISLRFCRVPSARTEVHVSIPLPRFSGLTGKPPPLAWCYSIVFIIRITAAKKQNARLFFVYSFFLLRSQRSIFPVRFVIVSTIVNKGSRCRSSPLFCSNVRHSQSLCPWYEQSPMVFIYIA